VHTDEPPIYVMPCGAHTVNFECLVGLYNANLSIDSKTKEYVCNAHCPQCRNSSPPIKGDLSNIQIVREEYIKMSQHPTNDQFECYMCKSPFKSLFELGVHRKKCEQFPTKCPMKSFSNINDEYKQCGGTIYGKNKTALEKHKYNSCKYAKCKHFRHHTFPHDKIQLHEKMCKLMLTIITNGVKLRQIGDCIQSIQKDNWEANEQNLEKIKEIFVVSNKMVKSFEKITNCNNQSYQNINESTHLSHILLREISNIFESGYMVR